jgi:hypothetical protein
MALRTGRASAPYLCLDVWLGPMEGARFCAAAADGQIFRVGRRRADEKRGTKNDFVLAEGEGISGFHAEVRCDRGRIFLKDLDSTNGTFARGHRLSGETEIENDEIFLLSTTPLRVFFSDAGGLPVAPPSKEDLGSSTPFSDLLSAATGVAVRRGEGFVDTRHLADSLVESKDEAVASALRAAGLSSGEAIRQLWEGTLFTGSLQWLTPFLTIPDRTPAPPGGPLVSPGVRTLFSAAGRQLAGHAEAEAKEHAGGALFAALVEGIGPVAKWLQGAGVRAAPVPPPRRPSTRKAVRSTRPPMTIPNADEQTVRQAARPAAGPSDTHVLPARGERIPPRAQRERPLPREETDFGHTTPVPRLSRERAVAAAQEPFVPTTGDSLLDQRARAIALELEEAATLYRFSTPEDRRSVMKSLVHRALAAVAPENRGRILSQIRVQFPVATAPPPDVSDVTPKLRARVRELEQRVEQLTKERDREPKKGSSAPDSAWKAVLAAPGTAPAAPEVEALRAALAFARNLEKFLLGLVQAVTVPGDATRSFRLSIYRYTLENVLQSIQDGKVVNVEGLQGYLRDLERWQVAILASHHESPRIWFEKLWKKANPAAIETGAAKSASWKLGGQAVEWWNRYKEVVRGLNPEVVQDQVLQTANKIAHEEFEKLSKRKN